MLSSKKLKPYIFLGGIFISLFFAIVIGHFSTPVLAAIDVPAATGLSTASLADTAVNIINAFLGLVGVIALGIFVYGGYLWMFSGGDPKKIDKAKKVLISATIGLIIILISWAIVSFLLNAINGGNGNNNNNVNPPTFTESSYVFKVIDYAPKGPDIPICRAIQATFDRKYDKDTFPGNLHLMKYCIDNTQCNGIGLGDCNRSVLGITGTFCAEDIAGTFITTDPNTVGFKPTAELEKMTDYKVLIDGGASGVQSGSGADCNDAFDICKDWDFKTGDFSDKVPPQVQKVSPVDGADNVCLVKSIAAQFNEEMFKPSLTAAGAFSTTPAHNFSPSAPSFTVMRESPRNPYAANTDYYPLLNADIIMDACFNKLDGNKNATAEGSPTDNYPTTDAGVPVGATSTWQFKTGETTQCVPKIDAINPSDSYYENPGNTLEITGENFDDIADTVIFNKNLAVSTGTAACFDASFTDTDQACLTAPNWDGVSIPNKITINVPAGGLDSNGAITGPVKVKVGQFQCTGQTTCKGGANKGLNCVEVNEATDCPGSLCGDTGSCDGGANAGLGCDSNLECAGAESAGVNLNVWSPHIRKLDPGTLGAGSGLGIFGRQFGNDSGTIDLIDSGGNRTPLILPCGDNSWSDTYIVGEIPLATPPDDYTIQIIKPDGRHSNLGDLIVNNNPPGPVLCPIDNFCSSGAPVNFTADGKRFEDDKTINDDVEFVDSGNTVDGNAFIADANIDWNDTRIVGDTPTLTDDNYSVRVALDKNATPRYSNSIPFEVPCSGRPKVVESATCTTATQSPSPYKNDTVNPDTDNDACINTSAISARFNMDMASGDNTDPNWDNSIRKPSNVGVLKCNTGAVFDDAQCSLAVTDDDGILELINADTNSEGFEFRPAVGWVVADTWYKVTISPNVQSQLGTAMGSEYIWKFHVTDSATACPVDSLTVNPQNRTVAVGATVIYAAVPQSANCNFIGACTDYVYNWSASGTPIPHSSIPIPSNTCNISVSADSVTPIGDPDDIMANIPAEGVSNIAQLTITAGGGPGAAVCGNGKIDAGEQCDDKNTFANDGCSATCQREIPSIFSVKPANGAANVCKNAAVEITFTGLMNLSTLTPSTIRLLQGVAPVAGSIQARYIDSDNNGAMDQTLATIYPSSIFSDMTNYSVEVLGVASGVKSKYGAELDLTSCGAAMNWSIDHCASSFTTGTEICKIDKVTIILEKDFNPDPDPNLGIGYAPQSYSGPDLFTCAGKNDCPDDFDPLAQNQHNAIAEAKDATGLTLGGITYSWTKSTDAPFTMLTPDIPATLVQADPKSGIGALTVKADGGLAGIKTASTNVTVAPCDNPWQPTGTYPYKDDLASSPANPTNFSLWYCRDTGGPGTADDLPALSIIKKDGAGEMVREFFFYDAANPNDALGLRVYSNLNHWPAKEWYDNRAPNKLGAPASTTVDGWEGIQAGRTIYVNAANHTGVAPPLMNIYLMSHSDKISTNLRNIYNQLKSNWKFAITEYDDGTDGSSLNPPADRGHLRKLQRDTRRITDLYGAAVDLYQSKISKGKYPLMPSGSYISGNSTSVWPSWDGALSKEVGAPMPHDPISQMSSLIGWWKLNEGVGALAANDGLTGFGGVLSGGLDATGWRSGTACKYGNCLEFDGTDDYIDAGNFSGLYSNKLTVAAWIKTKPNVGWDDIVAGGYGNFVFAISDGNLTIGDQGGKTGTGPNIDPIGSKRQIDDDKWHFVAATYDGLVVKLYIDGVFEVSGPVNGDFDAAGGNLYIGSTPVNGSEYFDGSIDEVRIWNTPLGDAEINNLFKSNAAKFGSSEDSGWDQTKNAFSCIAGADYDTHIYHYQQESGGANFSLYAALEWVGGDGSTWRKNTIDPCDGDPLNKIGSSDCPCYNYRQQEVDATNLGLCQNKQWDSSLGERCDGSVVSGLNGLEGRICPTGKCVGGTNDTKDCTDNLQCPDGGTCVPNDPICDVDICEPYCAGGPAVKAVCGNGKIESPIENCECSDFSNLATCGVAKGSMNEYYCYDDGVVSNDLDAAAIGAGEIDDLFTAAVQCSPTTCNLTCSSAVPVLAEVNNGMYEPWWEQCEPARGYCSNNSISCTQDSDCGVGNYCIALGNGGYYCDSGGAIQCNNGTRGCPVGDTLTSCIGGAVEWNECGGGDFPPKPYNYLDEEINYTDYTAKTGASTVDGLYGWCFR